MTLSQLLPRSSARPARTSSRSRGNRAGRAAARPPYTVVEWTQTWRKVGEDWHRLAVVELLDGTRSLYGFREDLVERMAAA